MPERPRLKKGDISINEVFILSLAEFKAKKVDDKEWRSHLDVKSAKLVVRKNLKYNPSTKKWEQTGREVKIQFLVRTTPKSYKDRSGVKVHTYPITFLFKDFSKGLNSPFRSRVGSLKKPTFPKKRTQLIKDAKDEEQANKIRKDNERIAEFNRQVAKRNILNGVQLQFFYDSEFVWNAYGLLWGPNYAKLPPKVRNPELIPYFSKHEMFIIVRFLEPMFKKLNSPKLNNIVKSTDKEDAPEPQTFSTPPETPSEFTGIVPPPSGDDFGMG